MSCALGVGCNRGTPLEELEDAIESFLGDAVEDFDFIASCDVKADEQALLEYAEKHKKPLKLFPSEELAKLSTPNPSAMALRHVGTPSVCEAAALLASGGSLVKEKRVYGNVTLALARK